MTLPIYTYGSRILKINDAGSDVLDLEVKVVSFGGKDKPVTCEGTFNKNTQQAILNFCQLFGLKAQDFADDKIYQSIEEWLKSETEFLTIFQNTYPCHCSGESESIKKDALKKWNRYVQGKSKKTDGSLVLIPTCSGFGNSIAGAFQFDRASDSSGRIRSELIEKPGFNKLLLWALLGARKILQSELGVNSLGMAINNGYRCQYNYFEIVAQKVAQGKLASEPVAMGNHLGNAADLKFKACTPKQARKLLQKQFAFHEDVKPYPNHLRLEPLAMSPRWTHMDTTTYEYQVYVKTVQDALEPRYSAGCANLPVSVSPAAIAPTELSAVPAPAPSRTVTLKVGAEAAQDVRKANFPPPVEGGSTTERVQEEDPPYSLVSEAAEDDSSDASDSDEADSDDDTNVKDEFGGELVSIEYEEDDSGDSGSDADADKNQTIEIDPEAVQVLHIPVDGGNFPVGSNLTWHGGVHLRGLPNQPVQAMADGIVVAARLPEKDAAKPPYGSRNFVLVKHRTPKGDDFWSLYMHLLPILIKDDDPALVKAMPWLFDLTLESSGPEQTPVRPHPDTVSESDPPRTSSPGEIFSVLDQRETGGILWYQVESKSDGARGWIARSAQITTHHAVHGADDLKAGKVVKFSHPILAGTSVGFLSRPDPVITPYVHWEVFSDKLVSGGWQAIVDDQQNNVICDAEGLKKLINGNLSQAAFLGPMTKELVVAAYRDPQKVKQIASFAYHFESEWAVDWEIGLKKYDPEIAKFQGPLFNLYRFWPDAENAGCDIPKGGTVYHYHPVAFKLVAYDQPIQSAALEAQASSIETHWPRDSRILDGQNNYNDLIKAAGKQYSMDPLLLKSLIAQESAFNPKAHNNVGYAGLTQIGGAAISEAGLSKGATKKVDGIYNYDMDNDERFDPKKSIFGGASIFSKKRKTIDRLVFSKYQTPLETKEKEKFYVAAYNAGEGTIQKAFKGSGADSPTWDDLIEGESKSYLWEAIPTSWGRPDKYREITKYVSDILARRYQ